MNMKASTLAEVLGQILGQNHTPQQFEPIDDKQFVVSVSKRVEVKLVINLPDGLSAVRAKGGDENDVYIRRTHNCDNPNCTLNGHEELVPVYKMLEENGRGQDGITYSEVN